MITLTEIKKVLDNNNPEFIERLAQESRRITQQFFGRTITLYAPLYLSNYCSSYCTYCGFHSHNRIKRFKLNEIEMHQEMKYLSSQGIENVLMLTGESYKATPLSYLKSAVDAAKQYFPSISLEVHPMNEEEYRELFEHGVDGITVYQETYDRARYHLVHISGTKADYEFRYGTPQRAAAAGVRSISMGILLGLTDVAEDLLALYAHLQYMEKNYPGVEYSVSFPRLRTIKGEDFTVKGVKPIRPQKNSWDEALRKPMDLGQESRDIDDKTLVKIICLTRTLFPRFGINLSTREPAQLRDHLLEIGVTRMSAGSNTSVGGYTLKAPKDQDPQFDIQDHRGVADIIKLLKNQNFDPVLTDWRRIPNETNK